MRKIIEPQMRLGAVPIPKIVIDLKSRDEIPQLLLGLQHIYRTPETRKAVFKILEDIVPDGTSAARGRRGMDLWQILVLGTLRLNCNWDYDKLREVANNHQTLRLMLGHGILDRTTYPLQTLRDNVRWLTPEVLDRINQVVVKAGHELVGKEKELVLKGRCDSFVVETNVHYPTDINLLFDAIRKVITLIAVLCGRFGIGGWRQSDYQLRKVKGLYRKARKLKHSTSKDEKKQEEHGELIREAHQAYVELVGSLIQKAEVTLKLLLDNHLCLKEEVLEIQRYMAHAYRQVDQIQRRVILGEKIPHEEKVFSVYEEHTEWISKGKAGVPRELGLRVAVLEDQFGYVLYHQVMEKQTDDKVALDMVRGAKTRFPRLGSCSFDKGFYTPANLVQLAQELALVILPKKGRLAAKDQEREGAEEFVAGRKKHAGVESAINALENHGLDRCPDHGLEGFKRYVAMAVLARNIQILGRNLQEKQLKRIKRLAQFAAAKTQRKMQLAA